MFYRLKQTEKVWSTRNADGLNEQKSFNCSSFDGYFWGTTPLSQKFAILQNTAD